MGEMSDYYADHEQYDDDFLEKAPVWVTKDRRVLVMADMTDEHLTNTIRFLEARGMRTKQEVETDPVAAAEAVMSSFGLDLEAKYNQLLAERDRRAQVPAVELHDRAAS